MGLKTLWGEDKKCFLLHFCIFVAPLAEFKLTWTPGRPGSPLSPLAPGGP